MSTASDGRGAIVGGSGVGTVSAYHTPSMGRTRRSNALTNLARRNQVSPKKTMKNHGQYRAFCQYLISYDNPQATG